MVTLRHASPAQEADLTCVLFLDKNVVRVYLCYLIRYSSNFFLTKMRLLL